MAAKLHRMSLVAAKEGSDCAQKIFKPAPTYGELDEEAAKQLEKYRKEREVSKKKEATRSKFFWKRDTVNLCLVTIKYKNTYWTNITVPQK
jgi:hypothetical protein